MTSLWMPPAPIEEAFQKVHDGFAFAKVSRDTVTKQKQLRMVYDLKQKTGRFSSACKHWRNKASTDKTWVNLKTHFKTADQDQRLNVTAKYAGSTLPMLINLKTPTSNRRISGPRPPLFLTPLPPSQALQRAAMNISQP